jgi:ABC-type glutathione transport system ATPase component
MITHYQRLLNYITPDKVHVMYGGKVVKSGGPEPRISLIPLDTTFNASMSKPESISSRMANFGSNIIN